MPRLLTKIRALLAPRRIAAPTSGTGSENCTDCASMWQDSGYDPNAACPKHRRR